MQLGKGRWAAGTIRTLCVAYVSGSMLYESSHPSFMNNKKCLKPRTCGRIQRAITSKKDKMAERFELVTRDAVATGTAITTTAA